MTRLSRLLLFWVMVATGLAIPVHVRADDPETSAEIADGVLLLPDSPLRIRFRIWVDGKPFRELWESREELPDAKNTSSEEAERPIVVVEAGSSRSSDAAALFPLLDVNGDERLTTEEITQGWQRLFSRDFDGNGLISREELVRDMERGKQSSQRNTLLLRESQPDLAAAVLKHYDQNGDGALSIPAEISLPAPGGKGLAPNANGKIEMLELAAWLNGEPDLDLGIALGRGGSSRARGRVNLADAQVQRKLDGGFRVSLPGLELVISRNNQNPAEVAARNLAFKDFDADKNDYLDEGEVAKIGSAIRFEQIDANHDGQVSQTEFYDYVERYLGRKAQQLVIEVTDRGFDLFTLLDENQDGLLSERELKNGAKIARPDVSGKGNITITKSQIPRQISIEIGRGGEIAQQAAAAAIRTRRPPIAKSERSGPTWFQKMDRNGDGDVSPEEFLGTPEDFKKLDADDDGLISAAEAIAAKPPE
jgi:Ca2+-binding EF-hand superfamily protein